MRENLDEQLKAISVPNDRRRDIPSDIVNLVDLIRIDSIILLFYVLVLGWDDINM